MDSSWECYHKEDPSVAESQPGEQVEEGPFSELGDEPPVLVDDVRSGLGDIRVSSVSCQG